MLFHSPDPTEREIAVLEEVNRLQEDLRVNVREALGRFIAPSVDR